MSKVGGVQEYLTARSAVRASTRFATHRRTQALSATSERAVSDIIREENKSSLVKSRDGSPTRRRSASVLTIRHRPGSRQEGALGRGHHIKADQSRPRTRTSELAKSPFM